MKKLDKILQQVKIDALTIEQAKQQVLDLFVVSQRSELVCLEKRNGWHCTYFFPSEICKSCEYCKSKQTCG